MGVAHIEEVTMSGPLDQLCINTVRFLSVDAVQQAALYNRPGFEEIDRATDAFVSDRDLMEGMASEAASLAGHLELGKLTCLSDDSRVTLASGSGDLGPATKTALKDLWDFNLAAGANSGTQGSDGDAGAMPDASARRRRGRSCCANMDSAWTTCAKERWP